MSVDAMTPRKPDDAAAAAAAAEDVVVVPAPIPPYLDGSCACSALLFPLAVSRFILVGMASCISIACNGSPGATREPESRNLVCMHTNLFALCIAASQLAHRSARSSLQKMTHGLAWQMSHMGREGLASSAMRSSADEPGTESFTLVSHCVHLASFECTQYTSAFTLRHSSHHTPPSISFSSSSPSRSLFVFVFFCLLLFPHCVRVYLHSVSSSSFFLSFFVSPAYTCCMVAH